MASTRYRVCHLVLFSKEDGTVVARIVTMNFVSDQLVSKEEVRHLGIRMVNKKIIPAIAFDQLNVDIIQSSLPNTVPPRLMDCSEQHGDIPGGHHHWIGAHGMRSPAFFSKNAGYKLLKLMTEHDSIAVDRVYSLRKDLKAKDISDLETPWDHAIDTRIIRGTIKPIESIPAEMLTLDIAVGGE